MDKQAQWMAKSNCREVVEQSVRYVDAGDAEAFSQLFAEDAVLLRPNGQAIEGREAIYQAYAQRPADRLTRHLVTNVAVDVSADGQARARSYVLLWSGTVAGAASTAGSPADARQQVGEFFDQLTQAANGDWLIQRREAKFVLYSV
jgi:uncharacterized protein (TIGR02246 family)